MNIFYILYNCKRFCINLTLAKDNIFIVNSVDAYGKLNYII
jgi:hypothetical protein